MLIWLNQRDLQVLFYLHYLIITVCSPLSSTQIPNHQSVRKSVYELKTYKHKLPKSKILLLKIFSILSYSKSNNKHSVPTWYIQNSLYLNHLLKTQCWGYLGLMTIEVEWNSKKPSAVCTVTEIPFFDELPKEENHSFLSLIYSLQGKILSILQHIQCAVLDISFNVSITPLRFDQACHFKALEPHDLHMYLGQPRALNAESCCHWTLGDLMSFIHTNQYVCKMNPQ